MRGLLSGLIKIALASLIAGSFLSFFGLSPRAVLDYFGVTPDEIHAAMIAGFGWAAPRMLLGAMIVLPLWLITYILLPPRD
ncbi:hypothetical protein IM739_06600 [Rhizobium sp. SL42]|nr:hypothetical protein IM739_06600 [Rhizobium sp. SL42]